MNSLLRYLLSTMISSGVGEQFDGSKSEDLAALTDMLKKEKEKSKDPNDISDPMGRLGDAFRQLKDMHKDPALDQAMNTPSSNGPSALDNAQWPFGPVGAPSQAQAQAPASPTVPMPMARPADAPQATPEMSWFGRNTAMMRDPATGDFIDPQAAAQANASPFHGLFS